jgi:hypothetical protein
MHPKRTPERGVVCQVPQNPQLKANCSTYACAQMECDDKKARELLSAFLCEGARSVPPALHELLLSFTQHSSLSSSFACMCVRTFIVCDWQQRAYQQVDLGCSAYLNGTGCGSDDHMLLLCQHKSGSKGISCSEASHLTRMKAFNRSSWAGGALLAQHHCPCSTWYSTSGQAAHCAACAATALWRLGCMHKA